MTYTLEKYCFKESASKALPLRIAKEVLPSNDNQG